MSSDQVHRLREKHSFFEYRAASWEVIGDSFVVTLDFWLAPNTPFQSTVTFHDIDEEGLAQLDTTLIDQLAFHIGMVKLLSYWKLACPPIIRISAGFLNDQQVEFFNHLLHRGLGEFFYVNQIAEAWEKEFVKWEVTAEENSRSANPTLRLQARSLVPMGGGKDSVVTRELIREANVPFALLTLNSHPKLEEVLSVHSEDPEIRMEMTFDPLLQAMNQEGYLNGHTPFSALFSFISLLAGYLYDFDSIALSNEHSANEANLNWNGHEINHQYSKSWEYEHAFRQYVTKYLGSTNDSGDAVLPNYFSLLRPFNELQITAAFSQLKEYHSAFLSCNRGQKRGVWCGECPKCLFVYIMLSAFLSASEVEQIFGQDLLNKAELQPILEELTGLQPTKSFECVGLRDETRAALWLAHQRHPELSSRALMKIAAERIFKDDSHLAEKAEKLLHGFGSDESVPEKYRGLVELMRSKI